MPKIKRERTRYHARPIDSSHISNRPFSVQDNAVKKFSTSENTKPENVNNLFIYSFREIKYCKMIQINTTK